jgi:TolB protein
LIMTINLLSICAQNEASKFYQSIEWSRDGKSLAVTVMEIKTTPTRSMKADIYVMKADGTDWKKVTGDEKNEFFPSWAKNDQRLYFGANVQGGKEGDIFGINLDGTNLTQLTKNNQRNYAPSVSPDGKKIVFNSERVERKPQIYVMNADGSEIKTLTNDDTLAFYNPLWSPDGKKIVYYTEKGDNKDQIWTMNADGSDQKLLTADLGHNFYPSWSADSRQVIFSSKRDGEETMIYSINADGTGLKKLIATPNCVYARISPDGKQIAFISGKFPETYIFIADADGSHPIKITG